MYQTNCEDYAEIRLVPEASLCFSFPVGGPSPATGLRRRDTLSAAADADLLALSTGIVPEDPTALAKMLKVPVTAEKFFLEAHVKLQPVDLPVDGTYVCGLAHSPRSMDETVAQAQAAAGRACHPLAKGSVTPAPIVSQIDAEQCIGCGACESFCPYKAIDIYKEGQWNNVLCRGTVSLQ